MAFQMPELGILALAMMIPLMSGGLNLAIIATANLSARVMAAILTKMLGPESPPQAIVGVIALALAAGLLISLIIGLITRVIVAFLGVHPILVTLGTMIALKGIAVYATSGGVIGGFPQAVLYLGNGTLLGFPVPMILFILCAILVAVTIVNAVQATGPTDKIIVVSVDGTPDAIDAIKQGLLAGTVAQYPDAMAYMAIETLVKKLNGETVPEKIYSPIKLITKDNLSDAGKYYKDE
jgi:ABC-type xylose transport system permease subunit